MRPSPLHVVSRTAIRPPVSKAIAAGLDATDRPVSGFTAIAGRGVEGEVDGRQFALGNHRLMEERKLCTPNLESQLAVHESRGRTVTMLATTTPSSKIFAVADTLSKPSSKQAVEELVAMGSPQSC